MTQLNETLKINDNPINLRTINEEKCSMRLTKLTRSISFYTSVLTAATFVSASPEIHIL